MPKFRITHLVLDWKPQTPTQILVDMQAASEPKEPIF